MKLSLKSKVILVVLLFTVILSTCTVMLSYLTYTNSFQNIMRAWRDPLQNLRHLLWTSGR